MQCSFLLSYFPSFFINGFHLVKPLITTSSKLWKHLNTNTCLHINNASYRFENLEDNLEKKLVLLADDSTLVSWVVRGAPTPPYVLLFRRFCPLWNVDRLWWFRGKGLRLVETGDTGVLFDELKYNKCFCLSDMLHTHVHICWAAQTKTWYF